MPRRSLSQLSARLAIIAAAVVAAFFIMTAVSIYTFPLPVHPTRADAAVVLGAAVWEDEPSPVFEERILHAINLFKAGAVDYIVFTGDLSQGDTLSEAEAGRAYALDAGVPPQRILVDTQSTVTYENLKNAKGLAEQMGLSTFLIVSDPLHMRRSLAMAQDLGMTAYPSPTPTTRYQTWRSILPFLMRETYFFLSYRIQALLAL